MRKGILFNAFCFFAVSLLAQAKKELFFNPASDDANSFIRSTFLYPDFVMGQAVAVDYSITAARLNYSFSTNNIHFITATNDTLEIAQPETFRYVIIQSDTFFHFQTEFVQKISHYAGTNLFRRPTLKIKKREKPGAFGTYTSTSSNESRAFVDNGYHNRHLPVDEKLTYQFEESYFLAGRDGQFYPATKKGFPRAFPKLSSQLADYFQQTNIDFNDPVQLNKVLQYVQMIKN